MAQTCLLLVLWLGIFKLPSAETQVSDIQPNILLNSTENYHNQTANWIFVFHLDVPLLSENTSNVPVTRILRVTLKLMDESSNVEGFSLFASKSNKRFQYMKLLTSNNSRIFEENAMAYIHFDHAYSGSYKLLVDGCESRHSCIKRIYETDLGLVTTNLRNLDVSKINISISTTPLDMGGVQVAFTVHYHNESDAFLPFDAFEVTLIPSDSIRFQKTYSIKTNTTKVEFRQWANYFNFTSEPELTSSDGYFNLTDGKYTIRIDPIDNRCNYPEQVVASIKRPCRRYIISNLTMAPIRFRRDKQENVTSSFLDETAIQIALDGSEIPQTIRNSSNSEAKCPGALFCWLWEFVLSPLIRF